VRARRTSARGSLFSIGILVVAVAIATGVQLSRRAGMVQAAEVAAAEGLPSVPAEPAAAMPEQPQAPDFAQLAAIADAKDFLRQPVIAEGLKRLVGADFEVLVNNLSNSVPAQTDPAGVTYAGCAQHACEISEGALSMLTADGALAAAILDNGRIRMYGVPTERLEDAPPGLQAWAKRKATEVEGVTIEFRLEPAAEPPSPTADAAKAEQH
jgi:hypothetical protein